MTCYGIFRWSRLDDRGRLRLDWSGSFHLELFRWGQIWVRSIRCILRTVEEFSGSWRLQIQTAVTIKGCGLGLGARP